MDYCIIATIRIGRLILCQDEPSLCVLVNADCVFSGDEWSIVIEVIDAHEHSCTDGYTTVRYNHSERVRGGCFVIKYCRRSDVTIGVDSKRYVNWRYPETEHSIGQSVEVWIVSLYLSNPSVRGFVLVDGIRAAALHGTAGDKERILVDINH